MHETGRDDVKGQNHNQCARKEGSHQRVYTKGTTIATSKQAVLQERLSSSPDFALPYEACIWYLIFGLYLYYHQPVYHKRGKEMPLDGMQLGRYHLVRLIGSGGMGEVYLAEDTVIHRQVAIKVIRGEGNIDSDLDPTKEANRLFLREAMAIARLNHPHILPLFDYGENTVTGITMTYMVMPHCPEGSLGAWLRQRDRTDPLPLQDVAQLINQAADALQHAHNQQLVHQDVKPPNFLIRGWTESNLPDLVLTDFGVAKFIAANSSTSQSIRGTPTYMAPEQWEGYPVPATDQYALALMTYQILTGRLPFQGGPGQMMYQHLNVEPQPPSTYASHLPSDVDTVILHALAKKPESRFASISAFARAFQQSVQSSTSVPTYVRSPRSTSTSNAPSIINTPNKPGRNDVHAVLAISKAEAMTGTSRVLNLPGGRIVAVSVPAGVRDGQVLRIEGKGETSREDGSAGTLLLTISIVETEEAVTLIASGESSDRTAIIGNTPPGPDRRSDDRTVAARNIPSIPGTASAPINAMPPSFSPHSIAASRPEPPFNPAAATMRESSPGAPAYDRPGSREGHKSSRGRAIVLSVLVLLIIAASAGAFYYFARSNPGGPTIDVNATATAQAKATATTQANETATALVNDKNATATAQALASRNPYPPNTGTLALDDPLNDNSKGYGWEEGTRDGGTCTFTGGVYQSSIPQDGVFHSCLALNADFSNFAFEVQATITSGNYSGIVFRASRATTQFYYFLINRNGDFFLKVFFNKTDNSIIASGSSPAIHTNLNEMNLIAVVAQASNIDLYVNHQLINSLSDTTYNHGQVGVVTLAGEASFSNARVWTL